MFRTHSDAMKMCFAATLCWVLLAAVVACGATREVHVDLPPLSGSQTSAVVTVDLGGPARLTGPVTVRASILVEAGVYHCNACGYEGPVYFPPPCEFDLPMEMGGGVRLQSGGTAAAGTWWQSGSGENTIYLELGSGPSRDLLFSDGAGSFEIYYFRLSNNAAFACADRHGGGDMVSPGLIEFPAGMAITIDYDVGVALEGSTWGHIKGRYR